MNENTNPLKELVESKRFKDLPLYKQKQQFFKLKSKLVRIPNKPIKINKYVHN